jgi:hypothetical protein
MSHAKIQFSTDILRRLGEELNPSLDQSILELVKNSFDADAKSCTVELSGIDKSGGTILISDNGDGMDDEGVRSGWLVLGKSRKAPTQRTRLNRIPAGSKGLGRLAALRMGRTVTLTSRPRSEPGVEYTLEIDWGKFDAVTLVDEIKLTIKRADAKGCKQGTDVLIGDLRGPLTRGDVSRLARSMVLLADPFGDDQEGFKPVLKSPEFNEFEELVKRRYFDDADYHLVASVDGEGRATASVVDWKGSELFRAKHKDLTAHRAERAYACPAGSFDLWEFNLQKPTFSARAGGRTAIKEWLDAFGGVHLYENGLRVNPYGNAGNDWLDMNLRRARSPEERPSTNNSIGRVKVADAAILLIQKTDRSGFIESNAFLELRQFAMDALDWMARRRLTVAEERRTRKRVKAPSKSKRARKTLEQAIEQAPGGVRSVLEEAFRKYSTAKEKEVKQLRKEIQLYRTLSTAGITAATFSHESAGNPLKVVATNAATMQRRGKKHIEKTLYEYYLAEPLEMIIKATEALKVLGKVALSLVDHEKRRPTKVRLHKTIDDVLKMFKPFLDDRKVNVDSDFAAGDPYLRGSEAAIESILTNILNNSLAWFEEAKVNERKMIIRTQVQDHLLTLRVLDNGPGIIGISKHDIWLPGETRRANGTGLGLTIVRDAVKDLGGSVDAVEHNEFGGAEIIINLPILGA